MEIQSLAGSFASLPQNGLFLRFVPAVLGPVLLLPWILIPPRVCQRLGATLASRLASLTLGIALAALFSIGLSAWIPAQASTGLGAIFGAAGGWLRMDFMTSAILGLVAFLGRVVTRFSVNYLSGDPGQGRFAKWMAVTLFGESLSKRLGVLLLGALWAGAVSRCWTSEWKGPWWMGWLLSIGISGLASAGYFALHQAVEWGLAGSISVGPSWGSRVSQGILAVGFAIFGLVLMFQSRLAGLFGAGMSRAFYVHAAQGFYVAIFADRFASRCFEKPLRP